MIIDDIKYHFPITHFQLSMFINFVFDFTDYF